jgi:DNA polymerase bacteriophage-type
MTLPPPPLRAGMKRPAGLGFTTVRPDLDFETYSEAGFDWTPAIKKWVPIEGSTSQKRGLSVVGAAVYAQHPSTEVLCMAYDLKDGEGRQFWRPGMAPPNPLLDLVRAGCELEAWNVAFEWWIWNEVCVPQYGWPPLLEFQTYDAMAKSRAHSLPGKLDAVGDVLELKHRKDPEGRRLLTKFSMPRSPTKADTRLRIVPNFDDPEDPDAQALKRYNLRDVETEFEASWKTPDLSALELPVWRADQRINRRGVAIDLDAVVGATQIIDAAAEQYGQELHALAGCHPTQLQQLKGWLGGRGVHMESMKEEAVTEALLDPTLPEDARRALEIRAVVGSASVKKVFAMRNQVARDGRLHDLYVYHGAHTGRPTGSGPQPTNLPRSGPDCWECKACGHWHFTPGDRCPWCFAAFDRTAKRKEWNPDAMEDALAVAKSGSLHAMQHFFGDAMLALAGTLRGVFQSAPGHDFVSSDYSAIEGVVTAALAGEEWRLEVFRGHGMIYEMSAAKIIGVPFEELVEYKRVHGKHHPARQGVGKIAELACLSADTLVLTDRGWVSIVSLRPTDKVNDGTGWVEHSGVVCRGEKPTVSLGGLRATADHKFLIGSQKWRKTEDLLENTRYLKSATCLASTLLSAQFSSQRAGSPGLNACAALATPSTLSTSTTCLKGRLPDVTPVQMRKLRKPVVGMTGTCLSEITHVVSERAYPRRCRAAPTLPIRSTLPTVVAASTYIPRGLKIGGYGSRTSAPYPAGMTPKLHATVSTMTVGIGQGTFVSYHTASSRTINVKHPGFYTRARKCLLRNFGLSIVQGTRTRGSFRASYASDSHPRRSLRTKLSVGGLIEKVYDVLNAGPLNRFVVATSHGPLIAHNCGFGGWIGSLKAFGAEKYLPTEEDMKRTLLAWRAASPAIEHLWGGQKYGRLWGLEGGIIEALQNPEREVLVYRLNGTPTGVSYIYRGDVLYCRVPSGGILTYHSPRIQPSPDAWRGLSVSYMGWNTNPKNGPPGWIRKGLYGGRATENVVQKVARDIQMHAINNLEAAGYPVVLHTYDEVVCEVLEGHGSIEELEAIMATLPDWAKGWPIKAAGGWRAKRYRKG